MFEIPCLAGKLSREKDSFSTVLLFEILKELVEHMSKLAT
jgi:hypothetical protein